MRLADARAAAVRFRRLHRHRAPLRGRSAEAGAATSATRSSSATGRSTKACSRPSTIRGIKTVPPAKEAVPPFLNFAPLENGMAALAADRAGVRPGAGAGGGERRRRRWRARQLREANARLIAGGAGAHAEGRPAQPAVVQAPDLRAGILYGIRREDAAGGAGEHRAEGSGSWPTRRSPRWARCWRTPARRSRARRRSWTGRSGRQDRKAECGRTARGFCLPTP